MLWSRLNTRLLRYAGLAAYLSVGAALATRWVGERLDLLHRPHSALLGWVLCYLIFGALYWLLMRHPGSRRHLWLKLLDLAAMTAAAVTAAWFSYSGLAAMLMVAVSLVLPWLLPIWLGAEGPKNIELAAEAADGWLPLYWRCRLGRTL